MGPTIRRRVSAFWRRRAIRRITGGSLRRSEQDLLDFTVVVERLRRAA